MFIVQSGPLLLVGAIGIATLLCDVAATEQKLIESGKPVPGSRAVLGTILVAQPFILLLLALWAGHSFAPSAGLVSLLHGDAYAAPNNLVGMFVAIAVVAIGSAVLVKYGDLVFRRLGPGDWAALRPPTDKSWQYLFKGIFYGGATEEILIRWGVMSAILYGLLKLGLAPHIALSSSILVSAALFAIAHLPAVAAATRLTRAIVFRTLVLNFLPGIAFGALFATFHLEAAMVAHGLTHLIMFWLPAPETYPDN